MLLPAALLICKNKSILVMAHHANHLTKEGYTHIALTLERNSAFRLVFMKHEGTCRKNVLHINEIMQSNYYAC